VVRTEKGVSLPQEVQDSVERNALINATRHDGKAQTGAVMSKVIGEFPDLRTRAKDVSELVQGTVKRVNSLGAAQQEQLLRKTFPEASITPMEKQERIGLPPLPSAKKGAVVLRLPPEPSGFMHIGHAMAGTINFYYREQYDGELWLRFEDTNPRKVAKRYYQSFREGYAWMGIKWDKEKSVSADLELIYAYGRKLIEKGHAYACGCDAVRVKELRFEGVPCEHRENSVESNLKVWEAMLAKKTGEGEYVIRVKGDMGSTDYSLRDPNVFRVIIHEHPLTGNRYVVWPTYDLEVVIEDELCGVTHVLRSAEFHVTLQELIRKTLSFKPVTVLQFSRYNFKGTPVAKRLLRPLVEKHLVSGWDDPRMPTIEGVKRRGILAGAIKQFTIQVGYTKSEHEYDWSLIFAVNRKLLDPVSKRVFFVPRPIKLKVEGAPEMSVTIPYHPEKDLGSRTVNVSGEFFVPSDDIARLDQGETFRLIDLYNLKLQSRGRDKVVASFAGQELIAGTKKLQWTTTSSPRIEVLEPGVLFDDAGNFNETSMGKTDGVVEEAFAGLKLGDIVQFPRYGFCRVDSRNTCILAHK
jgi:glutamyl-tRNA synthetase